MMRFAQGLRLILRRLQASTERSRCRIACNVSLVAFLFIGAAFCVNFAAARRTLISWGKAQNVSRGGERFVCSLLRGRRGSRWATVGSISLSPAL